MRVFFRVAVLAGVLFSGIPGGAQAQGFDPAEPCGQVLRRASDTDKMMLAAWSLGFRQGRGLGTDPASYGAINIILKDMFDDCINDETLTITALAQRFGSTGGSGTEAEALAVLRKFLQPGADLEALTAALVPSEADISAVYGEPLAGMLTRMYAQMFTPGVQIGPKPEQNDILMTYATTSQIKNREPVAKEFPGGYLWVQDYIIGDQPIVRFKFVKAGEDLGLAFDGLIFVNGHWVFMPKPWKALDNK